MAYSMGNKCTICGGKRPKKVKVVTKIGEKRCIGVCRRKKPICVRTTILPLFQDNYPNCAPQNKHPLGCQCAQAQVSDSRSVSLQPIHTQSESRNLGQQ